MFNKPFLKYVYDFWRAKYFVDKQNLWKRRVISLKFKLNSSTMKGDVSTTYGIPDIVDNFAKLP